MGKCQRCFSEFGFFKREDYCRKCGKYFCAACAPKSTVVPGHGPKAVRVCNPCFAVLTNTAPPSSQPFPVPVSQPRASQQQQQQQQQQQSGNQYPPSYTATAAAASATGSRTQAPVAQQQPRVAPAPTSLEDLPRFLRKQMQSATPASPPQMRATLSSSPSNRPPMPSTSMPDHPSQGAQAAAAKPPFDSTIDPDLIPRFLKDLQDLPQPPASNSQYSTNQATASVVSPQHSDHGGDDLSEEELWKLRLLGLSSVSNASHAPNAEPRSTSTDDQLQARLAKLRGEKAAKDVTEDDLFERFKKLSGRDAVAATVQDETQPVQASGSTVEDDIATELAVVRMLQDAGVPQTSFDFMQPDSEQAPSGTESSAEQANAAAQTELSAESQRVLSDASRELQAHKNAQQQISDEIQDEADDIARIMHMASLEATADARAESAGVQVPERTASPKNQPPPSHDDDPWCCICNEAATLECTECDHDLFCHRCFREVHVASGETDHKPTAFKAKTTTGDNEE